MISIHTEPSAPSSLAGYVTLTGPRGPAQGGAPAAGGRSCCLCSESIVLGDGGWGPTGTLAALIEAGDDADDAGAADLSENCGRCFSAASRYLRLCVSCRGRSHELSGPVVEGTIRSRSRR